MTSQQQVNISEESFPGAARCISTAHRAKCRIRSRPGPWFARALALAFLICAGPLTTSAQTTQPANGVDHATQDLLNELSKVESSQPASTQPAPPEPLNSAAAESDLPAIHWKRLIEEFRLMLLTAAAVGVAGAVLGLFVLLRREALVALAIPQVVAIGAAIGMRLGWENKLPPALGVAMIALFYFAFSRRRSSGNWVVPAFYVAGLCLSFLIIANHGQDVEDLQRLFTGVDVAVDRRTALLSVPVLLAVALACAMLWRRWLLLAQAPAAAELAGLRPARWDAFFLLLLTFVILLGTNALGVVMVLSMLFLPAATVLPWTRRLPATIVAAVILSLIFLAAGFYFSNAMNWPLSQSVGGVGFVVLIASQLSAQLKK
jgi:zinc/manganese transport system permease protein